MDNTNIFAVIDTETTGMEDDDQMIEFAVVPILYDGSPGDFEMLHGRSGLAKPTVPVKLEAMAVHHITEDILSKVEEDAQTVVEKVMKPTFLGAKKLAAIVAHHAKFDKKYCGDFMPEDVPWICTYKVAMRLWPDAPSHKNSVLFYYNELHKSENTDWKYFFENNQLHRALPDATITAHLFAKMLELMSVEEMIEITANPSLLPKVPFGKHKGKLWSEVDYGYLKWLIGQGDFDEDVLHTARLEMQKR